ncbi:hypothetical protein [Chitinophaga solisilvae]|uniref:hypothetical protein n=1 Tax=Chitinophaga solisilvae TaxID=1233460 RepID=UPI001367B647|nr:hypothetical protein [Chitinophaga solisilvae]
MYSEKRINEKMALEYVIDTDWFFLDNYGHIAVVASAGGLLPESVSADMEKLKKMISFFRSLPVLSNDIILEEDVLQKIGNFSDKGKENYLKDLYFMASRGFYYFDKVILNEYTDFRYFLKAKPVKTLDVNVIKDKITDFFSITLINDNLERMKHFNVNEVL